MTQLIDYLIQERGIGATFVDAWGKPATIELENQKRMLSSMGYDLSDDVTLASQIEDEAKDYWTRYIDPVLVVRQSSSISFNVRLPITEAAKSHNIQIKYEDGSQASLKFIPVDQSLLAVQDIDDVEWHQYQIELPTQQQLGYHSVRLCFGRKILASCRLIVAPHRCYQPSYIEQGNKVWGLSVQLYCLRSSRNWGIGDFTDLIQLIDEASALGADFIGLNPIHQLYPMLPEACSPYGPSSRKWLNYLYIDVEKVPGYESEGVSKYIEEHDLPNKLKALRDEDWVNYEGVAELKLETLGHAFEAFKSSSKSRTNKSKHEDEQSQEIKQRLVEFKAFVKNGGKSLRSQAIFEALQEYLKQKGEEFWGWPVFPAEYKDFESSEVKAFEKKYKGRVEFYMFLQWQAERQYTLASEHAQSSQMEIGLYRDLAVGVSEGGAEIWSNQDLYCTDVSVGAPPDILGPLGQKWGLPPMDPYELINQQYQPIIDLFSANMKASGALRIDHVMALLRLWWVQKDDDASNGAYVNYPVEDLLGILALESVRNKSLVIGEDLGTVPDSIREMLQNNGVYSYRLFFFEQAEDGGFYSPAHYPEQSMATLSTHDMPTLSGYWHCDDLALGKELGLYPDPDVLANLYNDRHINKQHILNSLHGHHSISENISRDVHYVGMSTELNYGLQTHMAAGSSALLSLQLEDWLEMEKPVNIPGTFEEYPNWKRKLSHEISDIFAQQKVQQLARDIHQCRKTASKS